MLRSPRRPPMANSCVPSDRFTRTPRGCALAHSPSASAAASSTGQLFRYLALEDRQDGRGDFIVRQKAAFTGPASIIPLDPFCITEGANLRMISPEAGSR